MAPAWPTLDRSRAALLAGLAIDNVGSGLFLPLALVYATRVVGLDVDTAGIVVAVASALGFAVPAVAGRLTHRFGPRYVVVTAQVLQGAGAMIYVLAAGAAGVFLAAALMAMGAQLFYCSVFVLVADVSTNERKERPFALVAMVRSGSFGVGTLIAAVVLSWDSDAALRWLVAIDAATFVVAAVLLAVFVVTPRVDHQGVAAVGPLTVARDRTYLGLMASSTLVVLAVDFGLVGTPYFVLEVLDGPPWLPGALLAAGAVLSSVYGVKVVHLIRHFARTRSLQGGALIFAVWAGLTAGMLLVPGSWLVPYAFVTWALFVGGSKVYFPVSGALSEALPPTAARAGYMATYQYAFTTSQVLAPGVVALFAVADWLPWAVVGAASLVGIGVLRWLGEAVPEAVNRPAAVSAD